MLCRRVPFAGMSPSSALSSDRLRESYQPVDKLLDKITGAKSRPCGQRFKKVRASGLKKVSKVHNNIVDLRYFFKANSHFSMLTFFQSSSCAPKSL